jgi:hypothetical protein
MLSGVRGREGEKERGREGERERGEKEEGEVGGECGYDLDALGLVCVKRDLACQKRPSMCQKRPSGDMTLMHSVWYVYTAF